MRTANRQDEARLDIRAQGFWGERRQDAFFDVRVSTPMHPVTAIPPQLPATRNMRRRSEEHTIRVREIEHGTFTPLVFSATGGMGPAAQVFYRRLAALISEKQQQSYGMTMGWIRCCLSFSLLRSAITCLQGSRSSYHRPASPSDLPIDVITREGRVSGW